MVLFSNDESDFFNNMNKLPTELINIIQSYIPKSVTLFLTKQEYVKEHLLVRDMVKRGKMEKYIRTMIKRDNDFVFKLLLKENYERWMRMKDYYYKECIYLNYLFFLIAYSVEHNSLNCRQLITELFEEEGLCKNQHKKKIVRYIRWKI
jgi:hypothetical protein